MHWITDDVEYIKHNTRRQIYDCLPWLSVASGYAQRRLGFEDNMFRIRLDFMLSQLNRMEWLAGE